MNRTILSTTGVLVLLGLAACGGSDVDDDAEVSREVITEQGTETVEVEMQVPTVDTMVVERRVDIDTAVSVDTIEKPPVEQREP